MDFGQEVKKLRDKAGITQNELAKRAGVSRNSIAGIEAGTLLPLPMAAATLINLARALEQYPLYFLLGVGLLNSEELDDYKQGNFVRLPKYFTQEDVAFVESLISFITTTYARGAGRPVINIIQGGNPKEEELQILGRPGDAKLDPWADLNTRYRQEFWEQIEEWLSRQNLA